MYNSRCNCVSFALLFLTGVLDEKGEINRRVLGPIVFSDKVTITVDAREQWKIIMVVLLFSPRKSDSLTRIQTNSSYTLGIFSYSIYVCIPTYMYSGASNKGPSE